MRPVRTAAAFAVLMLASAVVAPSVGAFEEKVNTGQTGFYTVPDDTASPGAVCRYENNRGKLFDETNVVKSRKVWTHGPFSAKSWVGHRIIIMKRARSWQRWKIARRSPIVKLRADQAEVATFKGTRFVTPENHKKQYRVVHQFVYYALGSRTQVVGKVRGAVEVFRHKMAPQLPYTFGTDGGPMGWCRKRFWPVVP